jgi:hypothetical protein
LGAAEPPIRWAAERPAQDRRLGTSPGEVGDVSEKAFSTGLAKKLAEDDKDAAHQADAADRPSAGR